MPFASHFVNWLFQIEQISFACIYFGLDICYLKITSMKNFLLILLIFNSYLLSAQEFGTKGNEFWLTYLENLDLFFNGNPQFSIYVSAETAGMATISAPATGFTMSFEYAANTATEYVLPPAIFYAEGSEDIEDLGLKIVTETPSNVFTVHYRLFFTEATLVLPLEVLGEEYIVSAV